MSNLERMGRAGAIDAAGRAGRYKRTGVHVPYTEVHVFRHTFATNYYHKGVDVKILSRLLGHADVNITYNIYVHLYGDGFDEMYSALVSEK